MKSHLIKTTFLILLGIILVACSASPQQQTSEPLSAASTVQVESSPTPASSPTTTATTEPSPTPTALPLPEVIDSNTVPDLQIVRSFMVLNDKPSKFMKRSISPDKRLLAEWGCTYQEGSNGVCESPLILLYNLDTGNVIHNLEPLTTVVSDFEFSPDGNILAISGCHTPIAYYGEYDTTCTEPQVWLVDTNTGEITHKLKGYNSIVESMVFSPDGKKLYTGIFYFKKENYSDSTIRVWDVASGEKIKEIQPDIENCNRVLLQLTPNGQYLITQYNNPCSGKRTTKWWDLENPSTRAVSGYQGISSVVSPDSTKIAVMESFENLVIHIYDLKTGDKIQTIPTGLRTGTRFNFGFTPDSNSLLINDSKSEKGQGYSIIDIKSGAAVTRIKPASFEMMPYAPYSFSPDGKLLFVYGRNGDYRIISGDYDPRISVWDTASWKEIEIPQPYFSLSPFDWPTTLAFSPDQKRLVAVDEYNVTQFGLRVEEMAPARDFLIDYLDKLSNGKYPEASNDLKYSDASMIAEWLSGMLPGVKPEDKTAVLETLCTDERFPCQKLLNVTYQAQTLPDTYLFRVQFANPDGTPVVWPPCKDLPKDKYCDFRTEFDYTVQLQPDGAFKILDTLPFSVLLDQ
jgi:WD40 repeat protein